MTEALSPLDADARRLVERLKASGRAPYETMTPQAAREAYRAGCSVTGLPRVDVEIVEQTIDGPGGDLPLRIYRPLDSGEAVLATILFIHGGGWVIGDLDTHDPVCRRLAQRSGAAVVAVDYRLAPEHPFPAPLDDALAALRWIGSGGARLGLDPGRLAVAGDSAGACLATALALMARDGAAPRVCAQALFYPVTDLTGASASYERVSQGLPLTSATMRWFVNHYLDKPDSALDWRASPLKATAVSGAPPALVVTCGQDPLCDEGIAYAQHLSAAGVGVMHLHLNDQIHGFLTLGGVVRSAGPVLDLAASWLVDRLAD